VLSGRGLCDELITRPEESYRLWCVVVCDHEASWNEEAIARVGMQTEKTINENKIIKCFQLVVVAKHESQIKVSPKCLHILTLNSSLYLYWKRKGFFSAHRRWLRKLITPFLGMIVSTVNRTQETSRRLTANCCKTQLTGTLAWLIPWKIRGKGGYSGPCFYERCKVFLNVYRYIQRDASVLSWF
jgi:hypothetical protein